MGLNGIKRNEARTTTRILIVEDEPLIALALRKEFEKFGYDVCDPVYYAEDVIDTAQHDRPDVMLTDIKLMGAMDGIEAAQQIHARFGISIAFISGYIDKETMERAKTVNPIAYFVKPFYFRKVLETIDSALQKQRKDSRQNEDKERF